VDVIEGECGQGYDRMDNFRRVFLQTLRLVHGQYQTARFELSAKGMTLFHSLPPVPPRGFVVNNPVKS
jgi:hypothetical protein